MYITRIRIKNFRVIRKIDINLDVNKNQIEKDVAKDRFKILDNKGVVSGITALVGRNSVGKSTIIKALSFIKDVEIGFISNEIVNSLINDEINIQNEKIRRNYANKKMGQQDFLELNKNLNKKSKEISDNIQNKKGLDFNKYVVKSAEWFSNYFEDNCCSINQNSMEFKIYFTNKKGGIGKYSIYLNADGNISRRIEGKFDSNDYKNYFINITAPKRDYEFSSKSMPPFLGTRRGQTNYLDLNSVDSALTGLISYIGQEMTTNLVKLCDEDIVGIKYTRNIRFRVVGIILKTNRIVQPINLSSGTKQFIIFTHAIVRAYKESKKYGLMLFDEIEINLHDELIQALLHMLISLFKDFGIQSIVTTHNLQSLKPLISNKQIFALEKNNSENEVVKASSIMKEHENIQTKQKQGLFAYYPDKELIRNTIADFIYELKEKQN